MRPLLSKAERANKDIAGQKRFAVLRIPAAGMYQVPRSVQINAPMTDVRQPWAFCRNRFSGVGYEFFQRDHAALFRRVRARRVLGFLNQGGEWASRHRQCQ